MGDPREQRPGQGTGRLTPVGPRSGQDRRLELGIAVALVAVLLLVVKPWGSGERSAPLVPLPEASSAVALPSSVVLGAPEPVSPRRDQAARPATLVERACGRPLAWRVTTHERWQGRVLRVAAAAIAVEAGGPDDPAIHFRRMVAAAVPMLGYCAPVAGPDHPPASVDATVWAEGAAGFREISPVEIGPPLDGGLGGLWQPAGPAGTAGIVSASRGWAAGRYVIQLRTADGAWERWIGIEVARSAVDLPTSG